MRIATKIFIQDVYELIQQGNRFAEAVYDVAAGAAERPALRNACRDIAEYLALFWK